MPCYFSLVKSKQTRSFHTFKTIYHFLKLFEKSELASTQAQIIDIISFGMNSQKSPRGDNPSQLEFAFTRNLTPRSSDLASPGMNHKLVTSPSTSFNPDFSKDRDQSAHNCGNHSMCMPHQLSSADIDRIRELLDIRTLENDSDIQSELFLSFEFSIQEARDLLDELDSESGFR